MIQFLVGLLVLSVVVAGAIIVILLLAVIAKALYPPTWTPMERGTYTAVILAALALVLYAIYRLGGLILGGG